MKNNLVGYVNGYEITKDEIGLNCNRDIELDSATKLALLLTLCGYKESDRIKVQGCRIYNSKTLNSFCSYLLNDKRASPRNFDLKILFNKPVASENKISTNQKYYSYVAFSGGIDSTAGLLLALDRKENPQPVWIGFGQKNEKDELKVVENLCKKLGLDLIKIQVDFKKYVDDGWSRWRLGIIPARNFLFAAFAAKLACNSSAKIYICAHKEEITPINTDKSIRFFKTSSRIFSRYYNNKISVETPFEKFSKPEIVAYWNRYWCKKYGVKPVDTVSCYFGTNCGICKACINRAVAFSCCQIKLERFKVNPFLDKEGIIKDGYISRFKSLEKDRQLDLLYALNQNYYPLPKELKYFVDKTYDKFAGKIKKRINDIGLADLNG